MIYVLSVIQFFGAFDGAFDRQIDLFYKKINHIKSIYLFAFYPF